MDFYERFLDLCSEKELSPAAAAREIGLSNATATHWAHGTVPTSTTARKVANFFDVSVDYLLGKVSNRAESLSNLSDDENSSDGASTDNGEFKFDRFCDLCKQNGRKQSYLYKLVGMPDKSGSNLRRTKNVKPEILEVWAKELHTTAAYLNGETDDPTAPSVQAAQPEKEKSPAADSCEVTDDDIKFALFGGGDVTDAQFEEVKSFARFVKERDANGQTK